MGLGGVSLKPSKIAEGSIFIWDISIKVTVQ